MNPLELILVHYNKGEKENVYHEAIGHILENLSKIEDSTIYDVAEMCFVSTATISRLTKKLGYKSFMDFKIALSTIVKRYTYHNRYFAKNTNGSEKEECLAYFQLIHNQLDELEKEINYYYICYFVEEIYKFKKINFYTYGSCAFEQYFQMDLIMSGKESIVIADPIDQIQDVKRLDSNCLIIVSLPDLSEGILMEEIIKVAKIAGIKILLLTNSRSASFLEYADYCYSFNGTGTIIDAYRMNMFINLLSIVYRQRFIRR